MSNIKYRLFAVFFIFTVSTTLFAGKTWQYYHRKGVAEYNAEMYDFALENFERSLEINPSDFEAANIIAEIYLIKNKKEEAIRSFGRSLSINNNQPEILCESGTLLEFYLEYNKAFNNYLKAVDVDPDHITGHLNLIRMYTRKKDRANADKHFKICYNLGKEEGDKYYKLASGAESENIEESEKLYKIAIEKNPAMTEAYFKVADIYRRKNDLDSAINYVKMITEITPYNDRAYLHLGHLYMAKSFTGTPLKTRNVRQRKFFLDKAKASFKEALRLNPSNIEVNSFIADIYSYLGDELREIEFRQKAVEDKNIHSR
ncbi:MAG: tetratricopeptide repeat protein [Spirochaetes bacterium]|nr:tetratricopeptide repeat protein [Spirochaetota bacterium]